LLHKTNPHTLLHKTNPHTLLHKTNPPHTCDLGGIDCLSRWILQSSKTKLAGLHQ
jgi:hypothetical protein